MLPGTPLCLAPTPPLAATTKFDQGLSNPPRRQLPLWRPCFQLRRCTQHRQHPTTSLGFRNPQSKHLHAADRPKRGWLSSVIRAQICSRSERPAAPLQHRSTDERYCLMATGMPRSPYSPSVLAGRSPLPLRRSSTDRARTGRKVHSTPCPRKNPARPPKVRMRWSDRLRAQSADPSAAVPSPRRPWLWHSNPTRCNQARTPFRSETQPGHRRADGSRILPSRCSMGRSSPTPPFLPKSKTSLLLLSMHACLLFA
mmetsp:Transcript_4815/g.13878  ORF Transcript_4815/g.13878 Transcript_4815/m.13878 type:complete len:255 (-) Transcript_4815:426-1190(-)